MGFLELLLLPVLGPIVIYLILLSQVLYRHYATKDKKPISAPEFPQGTPEQERDDVIASRKQLVQDTLDMFAGKWKAEEFTDRYFTKDAQFEDPWHRLQGKEEVSLAVDAAHR